LITTYRNPNLNSLSIFTAQFGYFGIVGLKPEQKVAGISITKTSLHQLLLRGTILCVSPNQKI
jgi:hypothetical protein